MANNLDFDFFAKVPCIFAPYIPMDKSRGITARLINDMIARARAEGYNEASAEAKVCQDIILLLISKSALNRNITVKGGVVMRSISHDARRATQDIDLDFIRYSLQDESILAFVDKLNGVGDVLIRVTGAIEELRQQDYHGKIIHVMITDTDGTVLVSKIDLGVHKHFDIEQEDFCFDVGMDDGGASLLINSKEQMLTEKLRSILKFGPFSTRYKDIFDIYYLCGLVDREKLKHCMDTLIFSDPGMKENDIAGVLRRVTETFKNQTYLSRLKTSRKNWLDGDLETVLKGIIDYLNAFT